MFKFSDVIGQQQAKDRLVQEVTEGRVPHALMLCGPQGVGKLALALAYGRYLCCSHRTTTDACGACPSCVKWDKLVHPDVHFMFPVVKNAKRKKESCDDYLPEWRHMLSTSPYFDLQQWTEEMDAENGQPIIYARESDEITRKLDLKSSEGSYKVVILWLPEKLHEACANKLLKLLEEPPQQTTFLLVTEASDQVLPTIVSRTQRFNVPRIEEKTLSDALYMRYGLSQEDSFSIAHLANGSLLKAVDTLRTDKESERNFKLFVNLMRLAYQRKVRDLKQWSEQVAALGREPQKGFLEYCQHMVRESFICNLHCRELNYMTRQEEGFASRFAPFVNERNVAALMEELSEAQAHVGQNVNPRMVFFDLALKVTVLLRR